MSGTSGSSPAAGVSFFGSILAAAGRFFGPSVGTTPGNVNGADLFKSAVIPAAIYGLSLAVPALQATVPTAGLIGLFVLDVLRRLPHRAVPGLDTPAAPPATS